jgi:hypothetical protein
MNEDQPGDILDLLGQLDRVQGDVDALAATLSEAHGARQPRSGSWSVSQCLAHLAATNELYVGAMAVAADRARVSGRLRQGAATPGWLGGLFIRTLEPPPAWWSRVRTIGPLKPSATPALGVAMAEFSAAHDEVRQCLRTNADLDLAGVRFANPIVRGVRFSLATGFHVILAHERRHLWQAWRARRAAEGMDGHGGT